jgi:hypothetical protein
MHTPPFQVAIRSWLPAVVLALAGCGGSGGGGGGGGAVPNTKLLALELSLGTLSPAFDADILAYSVPVGVFATSATLTAAPADPDATITIAGRPTDAGAPSPRVPLFLGPTRVEVVVNHGTAQRTYVVTFRRNALANQEAYVKASNTGTTDQFGWSIALSRDTLVVGAPFEGSGALGVDGDQADDAQARAGAAYVFERTGGTWTQRAYLKASNVAGASNSSRFGFSVAISRDTIVVGAPGEGNAATGVNGDPYAGPAPGTGAVYVFVRSGGTWVQQAYLKALSLTDLDFFGRSVAISGDTIVVGMPFEDSNAVGVNGDPANDLAEDSGAAYIYARNGSTWSLEAYLKAANTGANDRFGDSVAVSGDTVMVGADDEDGGASGVNPPSDETGFNTGAAYVYVRAGGTWVQQAYVKALNAGAGDGFGTRVALDGDTAVVSAANEASGGTGTTADPLDNSAPFAGAAYVLVRTGGQWSFQAYLKASNTDADDRFGWNVALDGDTLAVGAILEGGNGLGLGGNEADDSADDAGAVYVFQRVGATWMPSTYVKASNTNALDYFGFVVAVSGDTVVCGAPQERSRALGIDGDQADNTSFFAGAVYVVR